MILFGIRQNYFKIPIKGEMLHYSEGNDKKKSKKDFHYEVFEITMNLL